jgi:hypothetical protein
MFMMYLFTIFSPTCFGCYCSHVQGEFIINKNTMVQMWLAVSPSLCNNSKLLYFHLKFYFLFLLFSQALQPSAGYGLLWLCSPVQAVASCGSAVQHGLWPPVALQPSTGYGLLWLCSPARAVDSCGSAAQRGLWPPVALQPSAGYDLVSRGFLIIHNDAPQSVGLFWASD